MRKSSTFMPPECLGLIVVRAGVRAWRGWSGRLCLSTAVLAIVLLAANAPPARAIDEIQVYNSEINDPGEWSLQLHANYAVTGRKTPEFDGGIVPDHAWQGTPELAYGLTDWWEVGAYWPYAVTRGGAYLDGGAKLRTLFVAPHAKERQVLLGVNFELGYVNPAFAPERWNVEVRPILGYRSGPYEFIVNPIVDFALDQHDYRGDFAPAVRFAVALADRWHVGLEHYADLGPADKVVPYEQQAHTTYVVGEFSAPPWDLHAGIGHGWTEASDETVFKTIIGYSF